ncbi:MAG: TetR/AcrR family transcriptional regulator [Pseudomonadota bacterium]
MIQANYFDDLGEEIGKEKRGRKKRATAQRIFVSAIDLMKEQGFDGVSIEQICERAQIARATFFQHFRSKAALLGLFSELVCQSIEKELEAKDLSATEQLELVADHLQGLANEMGSIFPDMLAAFTAEPGAGFRVDDPDTGITPLVVQMIKSGQADGTFAEHLRAEDMAISLVAAWVALARNSISDPPRHTGDRMRTILRFYISGLSAS